MHTLAIDAFLALRQVFFDLKGVPLTFVLPAKANSQDDPLDTYIANNFGKYLKGAVCQKASGPLISPDLVVCKDDFVSKGQTKLDYLDEQDKIIAIEVKKINRSKNGVARKSGLDFNTTPPCGKVRLYNKDSHEIYVKSFYLFICLEKEKNGVNKVYSLSLCDGDILNADFDLYLQITGQRQKSIGLGTYGDGLNRERPMLVFSNPLGCKEIQKEFTLILSENQLNNSEDICPSYKFIRMDKEKKKNVFIVYFFGQPENAEVQVEEIVEPFPVPKKRSTATQGRGKFILNN